MDARTLDDLESAVLDTLLSGNSPNLRCLYEQRRRMVVTERTLTGVGFFTDFAHPEGVVRLPSAKSIRFGDVIADIEGLQHGAGFLLFIDDGLITMLEGYTYGESWPQLPYQFELRYWPPGRDLTAFGQGA